MSLDDYCDNFLKKKWFILLFDGAFFRLHFLTMEQTYLINLFLNVRINHKIILNYFKPT
jgi:hypothetical protein